ncbi:CLUMA_CG001392, isoform A [Clunio marinus]|uniref:CLUMA_CG001392, isoform A n=1 Tax=Clunio marinus TaxID=568069 RepID=A0A1J1HJK7_9DIPT|nr:CLUMA_CG001392, isoform A [Clunio marinus]
MEKKKKQKRRRRRESFPTKVKFLPCPKLYNRPTMGSFTHFLITQRVRQLANDTLRSLYYISTFSIFEKFNKNQQNT